MRNQPCKRGHVGFWKPRTKLHPKTQRYYPDPYCMECGRILRAKRRQEVAGA